MTGDKASGTGDVRPETVLVTGASGQVATAMVERGRGRPHRVIAAGRPDLDLTHPGLMAEAVERIAPTVIVNAAAYTAVDKAEEDEAACFALNRDAVAELAGLAAARSIPLVHLSTDYVFDGTSDRPYTEDDPTGPTGIYGRSKRAGEEAVVAAGGEAFVLRTAWVYSPFGNNFVKTMLRVGAMRDTLTVVDDQHGNPTAALDIAEAVFLLIEAARARSFPRGESAILHLAGAGETTWCGLAREVFAVSAERGGPSAAVEAIPTSAWPTPAKRPANSCLDTRRLQREWGIALPRWQDSVRATVERLLDEGFPPPAA